MKNSSGVMVVREKAIKAIKEYNMLKNGSKVIVGLSGGADSVCLLHFLSTIKEEYNLELVAAHINHGIRGDEANSDAKFSKEFAKKLNVEFKLTVVDCVKEAKASGKTVEEAGRRLRYEFFNSLATGENSVIATAHNSNDNAETVIFNIARGSSVSGAKGIPPKRENIIRPLIFCTREEIEAYCKENSLEYVIDSTNLSDDYTRNRIRHKVLPELQNVNSGVVDAFSRFSESVRLDVDYLDSVADDALKNSRVDAFSYDVNALNMLHPSIKNRVLFKALSEFSNENPDSKKIDAILTCIAENSKIQLYKNCYCETKNGILKFFENGNTKIKESLNSIEFTEKIFEAQFGEYSVKSENYSEISQKVNDLLLDNLIDCGTIYGNLVLRTRCEGDKITLRKRGVTKTLKKLFIEAKIPVEEREFIPVLADGNGIVWVAGFGVNKKNSVTENSENVILVKGEKHGFKNNYD